LDRLSEFKGFTLVVLNPMSPAFGWSAAKDDEDHHQPPSPTAVKAPDALWR
jgi:hypothetical protein